MKGRRQIKRVLREVASEKKEKIIFKNDWNPFSEPVSFVIILAIKDYDDANPSIRPVTFLDTDPEERKKNYISLWYGERILSTRD